MTQLLEHVELNPIAKMAIEVFLGDLPEGSRVTASAYEKWRSSKKDPFLPTYKMIESRHPDVPTLFNDLSDELLLKRRTESLADLVSSIRQFHSETGSKRIRAYNTWRMDRRISHGEQHPSPNLGTRAMKWDDILVAAGFEGCDPMASDLCMMKLCLARFIEDSPSHTTYAYMKWHDKMKKESHPGFTLFGLTSLMNNMGGSWTSVLCEMGLDASKLSEIRRADKRVRFVLTEGRLTTDEGKGFLYDIID